MDFTTQDVYYQGTLGPSLVEERGWKQDWAEGELPCGPQVTPQGGLELK